MFPTICTIGPFTVYSYGMMLVIAFSAASLLICQEAKRQGIDPEVIFNLLFFTFIFGIIGSRILYVIDNLSFYAKDPIEAIMLQRGGLSWFGGLILGTGASIIYMKLKKLSIYKTLDLVVPFVALAQSIGRIGCLLNGCCYGKHAEFGIYFPAHESILVPTQLYSSLLLLLIYIVLRFLQDRPHIDGQIFYAYLLLYSAKRFFIEFLRGDSPPFFSCLTQFQVISAIIFLVAVFKLILIAKTKK